MSNSFKHVNLEIGVKSEVVDQVRKYGIRLRKPIVHDTYQITEHCYDDICIRTQEGLPLQFYRVVITELHHGPLGVYEQL